MPVAFHESEAEIFGHSEVQRKEMKGEKFKIQPIARKGS